MSLCASCSKWQAVLQRRKSLKAVLFGGAAGAFATPEHLNVKLTFEDLRAAGLPLGSGVVMVFDETRDIRDVLKRLGKFFAHESCGKCYPCQLGTQRQMEILDRVAVGNILEGDFVRLQDVGWTMTESSLCGLGQTAASAVLSAMKIWPELFNLGFDGLPLKKKVERRKKKITVSNISKASKVPKTTRKPVVTKKVSNVKPKVVKKVAKATTTKKTTAKATKKK